MNSSWTPSCRRTWKKRNQRRAVDGRPAAAGSRTAARPRNFFKKIKYKRGDTTIGKVEKEKKALENEISLLNDDDYVARYARENYVFTREGEQVAIIPGVE